MIEGRLKLGLSGLIPRENELAEAMTVVGIGFDTVPTEGPITLWVNGHPHCSYHSVLSLVTRFVEGYGL